MMAPTRGASTLPMISIRWTMDSFPSWPCSLCECAVAVSVVVAVLYSGSASLSVAWICRTLPADSVDAGAGLVDAGADSTDAAGSFGRADVPVQTNANAKNGPNAANFYAQTGSK